MKERKKSGKARKRGPRRREECVALCGDPIADQDEDDHVFKWPQQTIQMVL